MKHETTRALYHYWERLRGDRTAPERSEIDPGAIRAQLGDVFLLEARGAGRYVVRLAGTRLCALMGRELSGRPFAEQFSADGWPELYNLLDGVIATSVPVVAGVSGETADGACLDLELLLLPLRHRGRNPGGRLIGSLAVLGKPYLTGRNPIIKLRVVTIRHVAGADTAPAVGELEFLARAQMGVGHLRVLQGGKS